MTTNEFFYETFPFFVSIILVLISPFILHMLTKRTDKKITNIFSPNDDIDNVQKTEDENTKNVKKLVHALTDFLIDGVSVISGAIISIATIISISYLRENSIIGYSFGGSLIFITILFIAYFLISNPYDHRKRIKKLKIGYFSIIVIAYNVIFIIILAKQSNLF